MAAREGDELVKKKRKPADGVEANMVATVDELSNVNDAFSDNDGGDRRGKDAKELGAYYTDSQVADFLVWWAVRERTEIILDPSFGGGVFLRAACKQLRNLGGFAANQVFGIELDPQVCQAITDRLHDEFGVPQAQLLQADFFEISVGQIRAVDAVVGNPPFIRYQRFAGMMRARALRRSAEQGLKVSELTSSWLPFLVHSVGFLRPGGRLAMVIPFEIGHASYALPVLGFLERSFQRLTFLTFRKKLFADLSEDTLLLLAEGKQLKGQCKFYLRDLPHAGALTNSLAVNRRALKGIRRISNEELVSGQRRLIEYLLPKRARELYRELRATGETARLGTLADVGIGYVTGANDFFHPDDRTAATWGIPHRFLRPCVRRGRALAGLRFTGIDWQNAVPKGGAGYLLELPAEGDLPSGVLRYLALGQELGVHRGYKCRTRKPWYHVPHVHHPDAFLTYMSGGVPRLVANTAGVVAPNTLHILRLRRECRITRDGIAVLWQTSLAHLSAEIEGHALGGGLLKLEPGEADEVLLPYPRKLDDLEGLAVELDELSRKAGAEAAASVADSYLLRSRLGLSASDCALLRAACQTLRARRMSRS